MLPPSEQLQLHYYQSIDIWKRFCEHHNELYTYTCDEYEALLASNLNELDIILAKKEEVIDKITCLEQMRSELIDDINTNLSDGNKLESVSGLIQFMEYYENGEKQHLLSKSNTLLIEIIESIKDQNKKNQLFIIKQSFHFEI